MTSRLTIAALVFTLLLGPVSTTPARAADAAPAWLQQLASAPPPAYAKDVPAVVLLDEALMTVDQNGKTTTSARGAVRVLTRAGRGAASVGVPYLPKSSKVKSLKAWLIRAQGSVREFRKEDLIDATASPDDVYGEHRVQVISGSDEADAGCVFGYEYVLEDQPLLPQEVWQFQDRYPVVASRFSLALPEGWTAESVTFNREPLAPAVSGTRYTWELRDLHAIRPEPASPPVTNAAPRIAVTYRSNGARSLPSFATWAEVSTWATGIMAAQAAPNPAIAAKAKELVSRAETEFDRIRAIGEFVQGVNYISIQTNLAKAGGYRPHPATEVFEKSYGDCKDKANLMLSMLSTVGVTSHMVAIYSGDPTYVRKEWASPTQFNHCIIAVRVSDAVDAPSVVSHPEFGRLLMFDPTDTVTPVGDLPEHEQGSYALLIAGASGGLVQMPVTPAERNGVDRTVEMALESDGTIRATVHERFQGNPAAVSRSELRQQSQADYTGMIEDWVTAGANAASVKKILPTDHGDDFELKVEFEAPRYGQVMNNVLLVFKPVVVARRTSLPLGAARRTQPVVLSAHSFTEKTRVALPKGFTVDEMPEPVSLETPFGTYETSCEVKDGHLHFTRSLVMRSTTVPAERYESVRSFFEKILSAEQAPVVLERE